MRWLRPVMNARSRRWTVRILETFSAAVAVALLATFAPRPNALSRIERTGVLVLATPNSPTTYYRAPYGAAGPDYDLAHRFAERLGVRLRVLQVANGAQALEAVAAGRADIAAPGVSVRPEDFPRLDFTPPYQLVSRLVVYRQGEAVPSDAASLASPDFPLTVAPGYTPFMRRIAARYPGTTWQSRNYSGADELLVELAQGKIAYSVVNQNEFRINRQFYPQLRAAFPLGAPQPLAWAVRRTGDSSLYEATVAFLARAEASREMAAILDRYYGRHDAYNPAQSQLFLRDLSTRLASFVPTFERAATATSLSWQLLAAVSYQESHWNPAATSPTGVRGLMMLTSPTADELGIRNRSNPALSIIGGARYISLLSKKLPASIPEPDRTWMALAAYNIGLSHLLDARTLASQKGWNPDRWEGVRKALPLLAERRYYSRLPAGYVNGEQAVRYVGNIKNYYAILEWRTARSSLPAEVADVLMPSAAVPASP